MNVILDHTRSLPLEEIIAVGTGKTTVSLAPATRSMLAERRQQIERSIVEQEFPAYGFNRGFGHNVDLSVKTEDLSKLQENLILSHSVGAGEPMDETVVRVTMLLRANSLARGYSGVRPELVEAFINMLNAGITPQVPELGSVGASGDLAPLSHIAMALIGRGRVAYRGEVVEAGAALKAARLTPFSLQMKEGLALTNGVQFMNAIGLVSCHKLKIMLRSAAVESALTAQVMLAPDTYYRPDFHAVRPHPGAVRVADWIWRLMQDSPIRNSHRDFKTDGQVQDPYNVRCAAQILGAAHDLINQAETSLLIEANSATDNPILLEDTDGLHVDVVSGGHFHGMPVAVQVYNLMQALGIMAGLSHQRSVRFVDPNRNKGLGRDLKWPDLSHDDRSISSGMMMLEYASASLLNSIWGDAMPSHLFNISTNSGQEDHVSMGTGLAVRLLKAIPKASHIMGIELAYIIQAIAIRKRLDTIPTEVDLPQWVDKELGALKSRMNGQGDGVIFDACVIREHPLTEAEKTFSPACEALYRTVRERDLFPIVEKDRFMADEVSGLSGFILSGELIEAVSTQIKLDWD
ncbi:MULTISPECIES: aromatic amino acid ammonia-lyase [unclassified Pseudodesulfovibrio]|uniref:HAL/PAL/TAL family ammonia-lyase n=1 Tax=unclassified Pseudodesulfovibrio TaxID=2661612 RepID=UPI000FEB9B6D|nr:MULTISPECIES: aromatic amino acid ammonia-lyase [unclassified Pseudodesulfovibrio]MCJ2163342.1 aromatic amino acid ammonia-lyase [Pseudodesulfovibrio sp. S3-i]RWU06581.1 aromatic amino acid lyase [Pseudodesulfovibrio sp. S3]